MARAALSGLDPLKDLLENVLSRLEALEAQVGVSSAPGGGHQYGQKPPPPPKSPGQLAKQKSAARLQGTMEGRTRCAAPFS